MANVALLTAVAALLSQCSPSASDSTDGELIANPTRSFTGLKNRAVGMGHVRAPVDDTAAAPPGSGAPDGGALQLAATVHVGAALGEVNPTYASYNVDGSWNRGFFPGMLTQGGQGGRPTPAPSASRLHGI